MSKQISATISDELHSKILDEKKRDCRSFSQEVELLLSNAIKERERQRQKNANRKTVSS
jgi:hypothetical protein